MQPGYATTVQNGSATASRPLRVISADSHVLEPPDLWSRGLAGTPFAARAPRVAANPATGSDAFLIDGLEPQPVSLPGAAGMASEDLHESGSIEDARRGGWDLSARLADQDLDGIGAEVLYPSIAMALTRVADFPYQLACARAYNDWLAELTGAARDRVAGLALVPTVDVDAAVAEVDRAHRAGLRGVLLPGRPPVGHYAEARFDPLWAACAERRLPVSFHLALTGDPAGDPTLGSGIKMMTVMSVVQAMQQTLSLLIFGGVFDRHPTLAVVSAEHDAGWVAHYTARLDQLFERHRHWLGPDLTLARLPSEYVGANAWFTFQKDPVAVETRQRVGVTQLMWASDYPHSDSTWPHSRKVIERDFHGVPDDELALLVGGNAAALYSW
jgi:predicted TIM-barrel fold metal-dependent hydrolase